MKLTLEVVAYRARENASYVARRMRVDRTVSTEEVGKLAQSVVELAEIVEELARRMS